VEQNLEWCVIIRSVVTDCYLQDAKSHICWLPHNTFGRLVTTIKNVTQKPGLGEVSVYAGSCDTMKYPLQMYTLFMDKWQQYLHLATSA